MAQALELKRQEDAYLREQYEEWCREMYHMSADEYEAYEEYMSEALKNLDENFDEKEYFDNIADEISNIEKNGYREIQKDASEREGRGNGGSGEVLSAERSVQGGRDATDAGQSGLSERDGIQGDGAERPVLEGTSGRSEVRPGFDGGAAAAEGAGGQGLRPAGAGAEQADAAAAGDGAASVSAELDENGHPFVLSKDGTTTFGEIREESGLQSAPIKLSRGFQGEDGKGYGLLHIEAGHGDQIRKAGFSSVEEFVSFVAQNYDEDNIRIGKRRNNGNTTYIIQVSDRLNNTLFIELSHDGSYWNVNSGGIFRKGYADKKETVAKTEPRQPDNAVSGGSSLPKDENAGISSIEPNGEPTVSVGKVNALRGDMQADGGKSGPEVPDKPAGPGGAPVLERDDFKPAGKRRSGGKKPQGAVNRVDPEGLMGELSGTGEASFADHSEPVEPVKPKGGFRVTEEMRQQEEELRKLLGIGDDEGDRGERFRDPDGMTPAEKRMVFRLGVDYAFNFLDNGITGFEDFAKAVTGRLGSKVKPFVKSWYEGAKRVPGYGGEGYTPSEEVDRFDIENFDRPGTDVFREAEMRAAEHKARKAAEQAEREMIEEKRKRIEEDKRRAGGIFGEAGRVAREARENEKPGAKGWTLKPTSILSTTGNGAKLQYPVESAKSELDKLASEFQGVRTTKSFIAGISQALGSPEVLRRQSFYYELARGENVVLTLRLSNHNANAENHDGKTPEISIVIKSRRQPNRFHGSESTDVTEYVYFKEDISTSPADVLSQIARDLIGLLETGEYRDTSGVAVVNRSGKQENPGKDGRQKAVKEAKERLEQYEEAMKKELAEKEAKYAEMDKTVEAATDVALSGEEDESGEGNTRYRDGEDMSDGERLRAIRALDPIVVEHNDLSKDELREVYGSLPGVEKDGRLVEFYRSAFKKIYKEGGLFGQIVPVLDDVLDNSVLAYSEADNLGGLVRPDGTVHKGHDNIISFDNYVGVVEIDGKRYFVRTTVQNEIGRSGTHAFFVSNVDVYENPRENRTIPITSRGTTDFNGVLDAKLQQFFERANSEAKILDMRDRAGDLSERLGTPVRLVETREEAAKLPTRRERRAKGFYNTETGEVVIVLPNHASVEDVENTVLHEVVGHDGMRVLFPSEEKLNNALDELYGASEDRIRADIDARTQRMVDAEAERLFREKQAEHETVEDANANFYGDKAEAYTEANAKRESYRREATEEYGADLAGKIGEEGFEKMSREELTFWGKLKGKLQRALENLLRGLKIPKMRKWRDREWAYVLHKAYKAKKNGGKMDVFEAAEDAAMRARAGVDEPMERQAPGKRARIEKLRRSEPVAISGREIEYSKDIKQFKKNALEYGKTLQGVYTNEDRGVAIQLQRGRRNGGLKEVLQHDLSDEAHIKSIAAIPGIIEKSTYIESQPNRDIEKNPDVKRYEHYVCGLRIGSEDYTVHSIVAADKNGDRYYDHKLSHIEKGRLLDFIEAKQPMERILTPMSGTEPTIRSERKIKELISLLQVNEDNSSVRFRDGDMGLDEYVTKIKVDAAKASGDNLAARHDAMKAIGGNLNKLRQAMARQREYDATTVRSVTDLARVFMDEGLLDDLSKMEMKRILGSVNRVVGRQDTAKEVQKVLDIMVDNQLRLSAKAFGSLLKVKGSKVNAAGVEVQGELDVRGQQIVQVLKKGIKMQLPEIEAQIDDALDRMGSDDAAVAEAAGIELDGLLTAKWYVQEIKGSKTEEQALRDSIKEAEEEKDKGNMTEAAYRQYVAATEDAIRQNKIERAEQYAEIVERLGMKLGDSTERAKAWRAAEKARVDEIHHNANSDMEGRAADEHHKPTRTQKALNSDAARFLLAPLATFDQMLRMLGRKNARGEGYLWNRFMPAWRVTQRFSNDGRFSMHHRQEARGVAVEWMAFQRFVSLPKAGSDVNCLSAVKTRYVMREAVPSLQRLTTALSTSPTIPDLIPWSAPPVS